MYICVYTYIHIIIIIICMIVCIYVCVVTAPGCPDLRHRHADAYAQE